MFRPQNNLSNSIYKSQVHRDFKRFMLNFNLNLKHLAPEYPNVKAKFLFQGWQTIRLYTFCSLNNLSVLMMCNVLKQDEMA